MDVIGTKVIRVFFLAIHSQSLKLVCNINIVYGSLKPENSQDYAHENSTKSYVHEFGFRIQYIDSTGERKGRR